MILVSVTLSIMFVTLTLEWIFVCDASEQGTGTDLSQVIMESNNLTLICNENKIETLPPLNHIATFAVIVIENCSLPHGSYAAALRALAVDITGLSELSLEFPPKSIGKLLQLWTFRLNATHLEDLTIRILNVRSEYPIWLDIKALEMLVTLTTLNLKNVRLPTLPLTQLARVTLIDSVGSGVWGDCTMLQRLELEQYDVIAKSDRGFLAHCTKLRELILHNLKMDMLQFALIGARTLTSLSVHECNLIYLSNELLADAVGLRYLDISNNNVRIIDPMAFKTQLRLNVLDLSFNHLQNIVLQDVLEPLKELRNLSLESNLNFDLCENWSETPPPPLLERLSLRRTGLQWFCLRNWKSLLFIDLSETKISQLEINVLLRFPSLTVDLRGNNIKGILPNNMMGYEEMMTVYKKVKNVTVLMYYSLDCDCHGGGLPRLLREMPRLVLSGAHCAGSEQLNLSTVPIEQIECYKYPCANCTCRRRWLDQAIEVDCRDVKRRDIPRVPFARSLLARGGLVDTLHANDFPETLRLVDLRDNRLSYVDANVTRTLFAVKNRRVQLSGNPIVCDCVNEPLLTALHTHRNQVEDYNNLTCAGDERMLSDVVLEELCIEGQSRQMWLLIALLAMSVAVLSIIATFCYHYERQIKVFLFAHGCCLSCLREEEIDADRVYDAFVSFCHEDDEFVNDQFLPELTNYKLCIHYRDWIVGEWISAQIARSIERSRRTIIVLSRRFLGSVWGMQEFRMAHASTLQEGRPRLIVVLLEDVLDDARLDAELRGYLATNTYVRWGERWFWDKLRYALPHRPSSLEQTENVTVTGMELCERQIPF